MNTFTVACGHPISVHYPHRALKVAEMIWCRQCQQNVAVMTASLGAETVEPHGAIKTFTEHVHNCMDNTAAAVAGWRHQMVAERAMNCDMCRCGLSFSNCIHCKYEKTKPHLRLHYTVHAGTGEPIRFPWSVEYLRGPSSRCRRETYQHDSAWGAVQSAQVLWWGWDGRRYAK